jgi:hypothetical protein
MNEEVNLYLDGSIEQVDYEHYHIMEKECEQTQIYYNYCVAFSCVLFLFLVTKTMLWFDRFFIDDETKVEKTEEEEEEEDEKEENPEIKYEDKYLEKFRSMKNVDLTEEQLKNFKNSIVMERTPHGNVIMYYNHDRETFTYFSDTSIPYRYLEVVGRKYVIMNNCKSLFVDMDEELKRASACVENKSTLVVEDNTLDASAPITNDKDKDNNKDKDKDNNKDKDKKSVFTKFKNYNTVSKSAVVVDIKKGGGAQSNQNNSSKKTEKEHMIIKEHANHYSCEGKLMNYSFLKKVDKKALDKNLGYSFSDFKKKFLAGTAT